MWQQAAGAVPQQRGGGKSRTGIDVDDNHYRAYGGAEGGGKWGNEEWGTEVLEHMAASSLGQCNGRGEVRVAPVSMSMTIVMVICPRLFWAVKTHILQFSSSSGTFQYSSFKPDHSTLLDTHPMLLHLLHSALGSCAALAISCILWTTLPAPSPPVSR